jgi:uncharacterized membrane protein YccC
MACGWGQAAARIGTSFCAVVILAHSQDAVEYSAMRIVNTLIGIGVGLVVSYTVLPVRGRDVMAANVRRALDAVAGLLEALARPDGDPTRAEFGAVLDAMIALQKTLADAAKEIGGEPEALRRQAREVVVACLGVLSAALARSEMSREAARCEAAAALRERAVRLAARARAEPADDAGEAAASGSHPDAASLDEAALQACALGLRKVDDALRALGR